MKSKVEVLEANENKYRWKQYQMVEHKNYNYKKYQTDYDQAHKYIRHFTNTSAEDIDLYATCKLKAQGKTQLNLIQAGDTYLPKHGFYGSMNNNDGVTPHYLENQGCSYIMYEITGPNYQHTGTYVTDSYTRVCRLTKELYDAGMANWNNPNFKFDDKKYYFIDGITFDWESKEILTSYDTWGIDNGVKKPALDSSYWPNLELPVGAVVLVDFTGYFNGYNGFYPAYYDCPWNRLDTSYPNAIKWDFSQPSSNTQLYTLDYTTGITSMRNQFPIYSPRYSSGNVENVDVTPYYYLGVPFVLTSNDNAKYYEDRIYLEKWLARNFVGIIDGSVPIDFIRYLQSFGTSPNNVIRPLTDEIKVFIPKREYGSYIDDENQAETGLHPNFDEMWDVSHCRFNDRYADFEWGIGYCFGLELNYNNINNPSIFTPTTKFKGTSLIEEKLIGYNNGKPVYMLLFPLYIYLTINNHNYYQNFYKTYLYPKSIPFGEATEISNSWPEFANMGEMEMRWRYNDFKVLNWYPSLSQVRFYLDGQVKSSNYYDILKRYLGYSDIDETLNYNNEYNSIVYNKNTNNEIVKNIRCKNEFKGTGFYVDNIETIYDSWQWEEDGYNLYYDTSEHNAPLTPIVATIPANTVWPSNDYKTIEGLAWYYLRNKPTYLSSWVNRNKFMNIPFPPDNGYKDSLYYNQGVDSVWSSNSLAEGLTNAIITGNTAWGEEWTTRAWYIHKGIQNANPRKGSEIGTITSSTQYYEDVDYNGYMYEFIGTSTSSYTKSDVYTYIYGNNINDYPADGIFVSDNARFWTTYDGIVENNAFIYDIDELVDSVLYNQSAGSDNFTVGTVAGATINFTVYKNLAEVLPFAGYKCKAYFDFGNYDTYFNQGLFTITDIKENGLNKTTVTAYDNCRKLDKVIYPLLSRLSYPLTLGKLFIYICAYCGIPYNIDTTFDNADVSITSSFGDYNTTCRMVIEWMAQLAGCLIIANNEGELEFKELQAPTNSRGSNQTKNYALDVSLRPIAKPAAILFQKENYAVNVTSASQIDDNRILDFTNNPFLKDFMTEQKGVAVCNSLLNKIQNMGDVYAFQVKLDNNFYGVTCGDSWVVEGESLTPRRGIVTDISINDSGVVFTSSGELQSLIIDEGVSETAVDNIISQVDSLFTHIDITKIVKPDGTQINVSYRFTAENTSYSGNGLSFDLAGQYNNFVNGENDLVVYVNNNPATINITNGVLTITYVVVSDLPVSRIDWGWYGGDGASSNFVKTLDTLGSNNFIKGSTIDAFQPTRTDGGFVVNPHNGFRFSNPAWNNEWDVLKANSDNSYSVWAFLKLIANQGWVNLTLGYHSQVDNLWYEWVDVGNDSMLVQGVMWDNCLNIKVKYSTSDHILYIRYND